MKKHKYYYSKKLKNVEKLYFPNKCLLFVRNNNFMTKRLKQRCILLLSVRHLNWFAYSKLKKFCIFTGRLRFCLNKLSVSRMIIKLLVAQGSLTGFYKKSN